MCWEYEFGVFLFDVIELATARECQKQLLMFSISNLSGRESLEIAVRLCIKILYEYTLTMYTIYAANNVNSVCRRQDKIRKNCTFLQQYP